MNRLSSRNESPLLCEETAFHFFVHRLWLMAHRRAILHICQKTRKEDFGVTEENVKMFNPFIIKRIQMRKKHPL
jgi:hypothetical protein